MVVVFMFFTNIGSDQVNQALCWRWWWWSPQQDSAPWNKSHEAAMKSSRGLNSIRPLRRPHLQPTGLKESADLDLDHFELCVMFLGQFLSRFCGLAANIVLLEEISIIRWRNGQPSLDVHQKMFRRKT